MASTGARTPFAFREENVYFLIDKCERLAYKARRFPAGLPTVPKQRVFFDGSSHRLPIILARHWAAVNGLRRAIVAPFSPAIGWTAKHSPPD